MQGSLHDDDASNPFNPFSEETLDDGDVVVDTQADEEPTVAPDRPTGPVRRISVESVKPAPDAIQVRRSHSPFQAGSISRTPPMSEAVRTRLVY